ncbi:hypothetical protein EDD22DRAFT_909261 [Suillus occidentalis]|nr:hypothetical protein EDD22DRAFT_909261 [Suillus occidentalis]
MMSGFCYGWDHPALCVAGVLEVEEDSHADALLQRVARSAEAQALIRICGTPRILGRCVFSSFGRSSYPQPELKMAYSTSYIYYHRHDANSLRFYALGSNGTRLSIFRISFSHIASNTGQILVNQWNSAKSLEQFIEREQRAQTIKTQDSKFTAVDKKIQCTIDEIESSTNLLAEFSIVVQQIESRARKLRRLLVALESSQYIE